MSPAKNGTATEWAAGMACRVVEHDVDDFGRGEPLRGGQVLPAKVTSVNGPFIYAVVAFEGLGGTLGPLFFGADDGWQSFDGTFRWRLMHAEEAPGKGSVVMADGFGRPAGPAGERDRTP